MFCQSLLLIYETSVIQPVQLIKARKKQDMYFKESDVFLFPTGKRSFFLNK